MSAPIRLAHSVAELTTLRQNLAGALQIKGISASAALQLAPSARADQAPETIQWADIAGRLVEVAAPPRLQAKMAAAGTTWVASLVGEVQQRGETAAWVLCAELEAPVWSLPYAPDLRAHGVDLAALPLVRARDPAQVLQAADVLLRSGAFGLVVADWPARAPRPGDGPMGRLLGLCQRHEAAVVFVTAAPADGRGEPEGGGLLGSMISLRLEVWRAPAPVSTVTGLCAFALHTVVRKDKRRGPGLQQITVHEAPEGVG